MKKIGFKRILVIAFSLMLSSLISIPNAKAAYTLCNDGTISFSSGSGTCSWHGGIAGGSSRSRSYNDPFGTSSRSNSYNDPFGSSSRNKSYNDPFGTSSRSNSYNDPFGTSSKGFGYKDPWGKSSGFSGICTYIDRSKGRC